LIKLAVAGISGRMGLAVAQQVIDDPQCILSVATSRNPNAFCGAHQAVQHLTPDFDVLIDFSLPSAAVNNLQFCIKHNKAMVIGGTGFTSEQLNEIKVASKIIPIFKANNMSIGASACNSALQKICEVLDESWQITIEESHHKTKLDKPSGTALMLAQTIKESKLATDVIITSIRDEQTVGIHKIIFSNQFETLEISHVALSRAIFSAGALKAAKWLLNMSAGLYAMKDLIF
jgi:4-hydroxy-tetrahydrodipicolinate reductase